MQTLLSANQSARTILVILENDLEKVTSSDIETFQYDVMVCGHNGKREPV